MKKIILILVLTLILSVPSSAMSYRQAREQALFLTDKMAYELNLTDDQYEAAYEINLDYLMSVNSYDDLYGIYWRQRNLDLSYILMEWQYRDYLAATYFYRPLYWNDGYWRFRVYAYYPHRDYYYFGRPAFYTSYRGGHSWRNNGNRSWYNGRSYGRGNRSGMRDGFDRGDYGKGWRSADNGSQDYRNHRGNGRGRFDSARSQQKESSTRTTVGNKTQRDRFTGNGRFSGSRAGSVRTDSGVEVPNTTFTPSRRFGSENMSGHTRSGNGFKVEKNRMDVRRNSIESSTGSSWSGNRSTTRSQDTPSRNNGNGNNGVRFGGRR